MKISTLTLIGVLILICSSAKAQNPTNQKDSASYALGVSFGLQVKHKMDSTMNPSLIAKGLTDAFNGKNNIKEEEALKILDAYFKTMMEEHQKEITEGNKLLEIKANELLDSLEKLDGISKTKSGLLYNIVKMGGEKLPQEGDLVTVHYTLKTIDGEVLDSSYERGEPLNYPNEKGRMIPGFAEGVQMLGEGGKIIIYTPPHLAYGSEGMGQIKPYQVLVFEINLLGITPKKSEFSPR